MANNNNLIVLSNFDGDVGHKAFYIPSTNTKYEEEILKTNKPYNYT